MPVSRRRIAGPMDGKKDYDPMSQTITLRRVISCTLLALAAASPVRAQVDTGAISGTVTDPSGAVIPGAKIVLRSVATGYTFSTVAGGNGYYTFTPVKIGNYTVSAEHPGFQTLVNTNVTVSIQQHVVVNFTLHPGMVTQAVRVTAAPALLQTQNASVGHVVGSREVNDLPLEGRNYTFLAQLQAGVTKVQANGRGLSATGSFTSNGLQSAQNDYLLDGIDNNANQVDFLNGTSYVVKPPIDAIQEFKVQTSNFSAEFGRSAGSVLNVSLKSGTNQLHGDAWEFVRNDAFDAADFFEDAGSLPKGQFQQNQFGVTLGGPVVFPHIYNGKNKTFFFADYEGLRIRQAEPFVSTVPTLTERNSGFTNFQDLITGQSGTLTDLMGRKFPVGTIYNPATTRPVTKGLVDPVTSLMATGTGYVREPFPNNVIPAGLVDSNAVKLLDLYPTPTSSGLFNNFTSDPVRRDDYNHFDTRIDHNFSSADTMFGSVSYQNEPQFLPTPFGGVADGLGNFYQGNQVTTTNAVALSETHTFSPSLVNELRFGYDRIATSRVPPFGDQMGVPAQYGISGVPQFAGNGGLPQIEIGDETPLGTRGFLPTDEIDPTWQINENLTKILGTHTLKLGGEYMHIKIATFQPPWPKGYFTFNGAFTSIPTARDGSTGIAQIALSPTPATVPGGISNLGGATQVMASNVAETDDRQNYMGAYAEDDWRVRPHLTLNLGLRWDYYGFPYERFGRQANFVPGAPGSTAEYQVPISTCTGPYSSSFLSTLSTSGIRLVCSGNRSLASAPWTNLAPRVGFAWQMTNKLVARGAYGIFYNGVQNLGYGPNIGVNYPFVYTFNDINPSPEAPIVFSDGALGTLSTGLSGFAFTPLAVNGHGLSLNGFQNNLTTPNVQEWNFSLQGQLTPNQTVQLAYVGNVSRNLYAGIGANEPSEILPPTAREPDYVPFPLLAIGSSFVTTQGNSDFNSLQATYERRFAGGLTVLANYTYSKCMTDARDLLIGTIGGYRAPYLPDFGIQADYGLCDFDTPNLFHLSGTYVLPVGNGRRFLTRAQGWANTLLGGWEANWILDLQDGYPFTVGCPISTTSGLGCNALLTGQNIYAGKHDVNQWVNPLAFANPAAATAVGQSNYTPLGGGPAQALGPPFHPLDFSLFKELQTSERTHLEFRAEVFNIFNQPNFSTPSFLNFLDRKTFGEVTSTVDEPYDSREVQLALKFYW
jgi:hypothetical protein